MTNPHAQRIDVDGPTLELATQMPRVLVGTAWLDKNRVKTDACQRKVISKFAYALQGSDADGPVYDIADLPPEKYYADAAVLFEKAEQLALAMFEDIFFGGGCGEEPCCGPSGIWHNIQLSRNDIVPESMTYGEWTLRRGLRN